MEGTQWKKHNNFLVGKLMKKNVTNERYTYGRQKIIFHWAQWVNVGNEGSSPIYSPYHLLVN